MRVVSQRILPCLRVAAPRLIAGGWAVWAGSTAWAYRFGAPEQLQRLENVLHVDVWVLWLISALLLTAGAVLPTGSEGWGRNVVGWLRGGGLSLAAGLLGLWAVEFFAADASRGWVSGKNYLLLAFCALTHSWWIGRNRAPGKKGT